MIAQAGGVVVVWWAVMKIDLKSLPPDGGRAELRGEDPAAALAWDYGERDVVRPSGPMRWELGVRLVGTELLAEGTVEAEFSGTCCRCGGPLKRVYSSEVSVEREVAPDAAEADLTSDLRETILLALPNHPVCSDDCPGPAPAASWSGRGDAPDAPLPAGPWGALDGIFGGTTQENQRPRDKNKTPKRNTKHRS